VRRLTLRHPAGGAHEVLLFGSGILGGAIAARLGAQATMPPAELHWPWADANGRCRMATLLHQSLDADCPAAVSLIWAAGRSGMGSTTEDMARETALVVELIEFATALASSSDAAVHMHLISSAGGLFDGHTHVGSDTQATPERPYGHGKLAQEQLLAAAAAAHPGLSTHVYRPTTVYGFQAGARMGLIPVLILNGLAGRTSTIIGRADTIRDYVATEDVARFVGGRVQQLASAPPSALLLASGRPTPLGEIVAETESLLGTRLYLRYDPRPSNSANMSFRPSATPTDLRPVDLRSGIRRVAQAVRTHAYRLQHG
jgi:UDP-glucose 4-epimerase